MFIDVNHPEMAPQPPIMFLFIFSSPRYARLLGLGLPMYNYNIPLANGGEFELFIFKEGMDYVSVLRLCNGS